MMSGRTRRLNLRRLKKSSLSETTEEEGEDLINLDDDEMDVDADIPADDDDDSGHGHLR